MLKHLFFMVCSCLSLSALFFSLQGCTNPFSSPSETIVLITVETLRPDHLSCYGYDRNTSPNIKLLATNALLYQNCFAAASSTAPSVTSILTSLYPSQHHVTEHFLTKLADSQKTIAEILKEESFLCAAFIGNPVITKERNIGQGFDLYDDELPQLELNRKVPERIADPLTNAAIHWLKSTSGNRFLWLHYQDPHGPYYPPKAWQTSFHTEVSDKKNVTLPLLKNHSGYKGIPRYQKLFDRRDLSYYTDMYDSEIRYLDHSIGRLLSFLKDKGIYHSSTIILTADHGEAFGENDYYFSHGHLSTPDQTKVPLIIKLPEMTKGTKEPLPVSTLDIFPTILSQIQIQPPENISGKCLPGLPDYRKAEKRLFFTETAWHYAVVSNYFYYTKEKPRLKDTIINPVSGGKIYRFQPAFYQIKENGGLPIKNREDNPTMVMEMQKALSIFLKDIRSTPVGNISESKRKILESLGYLQ